MQPAVPRTTPPIQKPRRIGSNRRPRTALLGSPFPAARDKGSGFRRSVERGVVDMRFSFSKLR
jgi:hypothetical protein